MTDRQLAVPEAVTRFEAALAPYDQHFAEMLDGTGISLARFKATAMEAIRTNPDILKATLPSIINAVMTAANFAIRVDGTHGALVRYRDKVQFICMYQGYVVLAGRGGFTLSGGIVREGDAFDWDEGAPARLSYKKDIKSGPLGPWPKRKLLAAWAKAESKVYPPLICVMTIDEVHEIRDASPGYNYAKANNKRSPWIDPVFYPQMVRKTPIRRLARDVPFEQLQMAAAIETMHHDLGRTVHVDEDETMIIDAEPVGDAPPAESQTANVGTIAAPRFVVETADETRVFKTIERWQGFLLSSIGKATNDELLQRLAEFKERNAANFDELNATNPKEVSAVLTALDRKLGVGQQANDIPF